MRTGFGARHDKAQGWQALASTQRGRRTQLRRVSKGLKAHVDRDFVKRALWGGQTRLRDPCVLPAVVQRIEMDTSGAVDRAWLERSLERCTAVTDICISGISLFEPARIKVSTRHATCATVAPTLQ